MSLGSRLIVENISKTYQKNTIVSGVSLQVQHGQVVGLLGPNGAGKTTCFCMISGLITTDSGRITLDGVDITKLPLYRRAKLGLGYLPQESSVFRNLTVGDNIMAALELQNLDKVQRIERQQELLEEFHIAHIKDRSASKLSGGERRRTELARCLACNPQFIMLDEPLAGIDPIAVQDIQQLIQRLKSHNIGVLITDHNVYEALRIIDYAYVLYQGSIIAEGAAQSIVQDPKVKSVYLGENFAADMVSNNVL